MEILAQAAGFPTVPGLAAPNPLEILARAAGPFAGPGVPSPVEVIARSVGMPAFPLPDIDGTGVDPAAALLESFWKLWMENQTALRRQSLRLMSGNQADAEDALGNAMLKASQKFSAYAGSILNERAWLSRLVHNVCMDFHRGQRRLSQFAELIPTEDPDGAQEIEIGDGIDPEESLAARQSVQRLRQALDEMPPKLREPFVMRFLQDLSYEEIAARLGLTNCTVRKRVQLARDYLKRYGIR
ncbi:MAG: sigma-70 family RNA polymerase sigma factor [Magnetospirillum sp. WYHS-4]